MAESVRGRLLVATPPLLDPNFSRAVVLMLEHNPDGALGVVLNRVTGTSVGEVLPAWGDLAVSPGLVHIGGPVQPDGMIGLAALGALGAGEAPEVHELWPGIGTVDLGRGPESAGGLVEGIRCFVGHSGWGPGQLEGELGTGSWFVVDRMPDDLWTDDAEGMWRRVLRRQPGRLAVFADCPLDPSVN